MNGPHAMWVALLVPWVMGTHPARLRQATCGNERWAIKTLTDPDAMTVTLSSVPSTVEQLAQLPAPAWDVARRRDAVEQTTYTLSATLIGFKLEKDSDIHAVIEGDTGRTMIVELPAPACARGSRVLATLRAVRASFLQTFGRPMAGVFRRLGHPVRVTVTGVGFFDRLHGQTGVAPNGMELHPVLSLQPLK